MSRGPLSVLIESVDKRTYKVDQVIKIPGIWAVYYRGAPFGLRNAHHLDDTVIPRYKRTVFSLPGYAENLCNRLNTQFKTSDFTVVQCGGS